MPVGELAVGEAQAVGWPSALGDLVASASWALGEGCGRRLGPARTTPPSASWPVPAELVMNSNFQQNREFVGSSA